MSWITTLGTSRSVTPKYSQALPAFSWSVAIYERLTRNTQETNPLRKTKIVACCHWSTFLMLRARAFPHLWHLQRGTKALLAKLSSKISQKKDISHWNYYFHTVEHHMRCGFFEQIKLMYWPRFLLSRPLQVDSVVVGIIPVRNRIVLSFDWWQNDPLKTWSGRNWNGRYWTICCFRRPALKVFYSVS